MNVLGVLGDVVSAPGGLTQQIRDAVDAGMLHACSWPAVLCGVCDCDE